MNEFSPVEQHYSQGNIFETILSHLQKAGIDTTSITRNDIAAVDEFHIRGQEMTRELAASAGLKPGMRILDVGCGLGGPCRLFAAEYGCLATGIDITAEYIDAATKLSRLTKLDQGTNFVQGSATELPFTNNSFDIVWTQHVQMNIADKKKFYGEVSRVLMPGGRFVYYDVFGVDDKEVYFPLPWADTASISHLMSTTALKDYLADAGLVQINSTDQSGKSIASVEKAIRHFNKDALGPHLMMGASAVEKLRNLLRNLSEKRIVVESGIAKKIH